MIIRETVWQHGTTTRTVVDRAELDGESALAEIAEYLSFSTVYVEEFVDDGTAIVVATEVGEDVIYHML